MSLSLLPKKEQTGSRPRCVLLTDGPADVVARRLTRLIALDDVTIRAHHVLAPRGFVSPRECQLDKEGSPIEEARRLDLRRWWLGRADYWKTPTWDLAAQADIRGEPGIVLFEAKAHIGELEKECCGKPLKPDASPQTRANHEAIAAAIRKANIGLARSTGSTWRLSRDAHYQMSNRFAWAWSVARQGTPVILVYLGYLGAVEMKDSVLIDDDAAWDRAVHAHASAILPRDVWGRRIDIEKASLQALIRTTEQPLWRDHVG